MDSSSATASPFVIPDEHLTVGQIRVGDRVELLTQQTHYILDRLAQDEWKVHAFETPHDWYPVKVLGSQQTMAGNDLIPDILAEGLCAAVRVMTTGAKMVSRPVKQIVWKRGYNA